MKIHGSDTPVRDLTRWNRAGLSRFRYVEGGAAEWLEYLRVAHMLLHARSLGDAASDDPDVWRKGFEDGELPGGLPVMEAATALRSAWQQPPPQAYVEDVSDYRAALAAAYARRPLDQTAQISRAFVRAFHILTETLDAYANEGYLATATQAPHLRRLLELIAFEPRLPASAEVPLAFEIVEETPRQTLSRGLSVEYMPVDGSPVLTFESLADLIVDPGINLMRAVGHDNRVDAIGAAAKTFALMTTGVLNASLGGTMGVLSEGAALQGFAVTATDKVAGTITVERGLPAGSFTEQGASMLLNPSEVHDARPRGSTWLHFAQAPAVYVGQVVAFSYDEDRVDDFTILGGGIAKRSRAMDILRGGSFSTETIAGFEFIEPYLSFYFGDTATVLEVRGRDVRISRTVPADLLAVYPAARKVVPQNPDADPADQQILILGGYEIPEGAEPVGDLVTLGAGIHVDTALPGAIAEGDPVALRMDTGEVAAGFISDIEKDGEDGFALTVALPTGFAETDVVEIAAAFTGTSGIVHETRSDDPLFEEGETALEIEIGSEYDALLKPGRVLLVAPDSETAGLEEAGEGMMLTILTAERSGGILTLSFEEDLADLEGFAKGYTVIYGNVAVFGHGKSLPEQVLGSGDGTVAGQVMELPSAEIATRRDAGFPGGVIPDMEITVDRRVLRLVLDAEEADPLQPSYVVRLNDEGVAEVHFVSRLATGTDNVRLTRFRQGSGQKGNDVPPFAITKTTPKEPIIGAVIQPIEPQFGADLEGAETLKSQGGSYFALLDRALSARDFERLAESTTMVWHAHADLRREAGSQGSPTIVLTVVPSGGGSVEPIRDDLTDYLIQRAMPGTVLDIEEYRAAPVKGVAVVNLKKGYAKDVAIAEEIQDAVYGALKLEARGLGRTLFVTEITAVIEAHEAVQNLVFTLVPDWDPADAPRVALSATDAIQAVMPDPTMTVFVADPADIEIEWGTG
ncbi:hypothetical protein [Rhodovulum sulfidophilum]|uniref:hypothetical protein n=1 Tax=Rhodovulum sulfidophilum TaxID=35806 RepID=UPI0009514837|nr:hypothetical protein [Rhodovulum sulfidophilum]OLS52122.1 hypothetical protein BV392_09030 [Rhodovulum sulfidophilum]